MSCKGAGGHFCTMLSEFLSGLGGVTIRYCTSPAAPQIGGYGTKFVATKRLPKNG